MDFVNDLKTEIERIAPFAGKLLSDKLIDFVGSGEKIQAYGNGAMAEKRREIEHLSALIPISEFGNFYR